MKKVSKKSIVLWSSLVLGASLLWRSLSVHEADSSLLLPLAPGDEATYEVSVSLLQSQGGQGDSQALLLTGELKQQVLADGGYRTQWTRIDSFTLLGEDASDARPALLSQPFLSYFSPQTSRFEHRSAAALPETLRKIQANMLDKMLLPFPAGESPTLAGERAEKDDLGPYTVFYRSQATEGGLTIERQWLGYAGASIQVEPGLDLLTYDLKSSGRLARLEGSLALGIGPHRYLNKISVRLSGSQAPSREQPMSKPQDLQAIEGSPNEHVPRPTQARFSENLKELEAINEHSEGKAAYQVFSQLKEDLIAQPELGQKIADLILRTTERDASSQRRLSILFGALAQSSSAQHAELLGELAQQCADKFCKVQALVGLSDHKHPTGNAAAKIMDLARQKGDKEVQGTALLAAGSLGHKLPQELSELPALLQAQIDDPALAPIKSTVLAAMGNHGDAAYRQILERELGAKSIKHRAAAVYSLRHIPGAQKTLLGLLDDKQDKVVLGEAYKALAYQNLASDEYRELAQKSLLLKDQDLQTAAARTLVRAYEREPEKLKEVLWQFSEETSYQGVKDYVAAEIAPLAPATP